MRKLRSRKGHAFVELSSIFMVLFLLTVFPMINLLGLAVSAASLVLLAHQTASAAASRDKFDQSLVAVNEEATSFLSNGIANFVRMHPVGGYKKSGTDLYIHVTDFHTNVTTLVGPNKPLPSAPDPLSNIYEYTTRTTYEVGPVVAVSTFPILSDVPGLGKPAILSFVASRAVEHVNALQTKAPSQSAQSGSGLGLSLSGGGSELTDPTGGDWNYPTIYQMIADQGQTVVSSDVLIVPANNESWTVSKAQALSGTHVWLDTRADGLWMAGATGSQVNADGFTLANGFAPVNVSGHPAGALLGEVGTNGTIYTSGKSQLNFAPPPNDSGFVQFKFNDYPGQYMDNTGQMIVRVIVTR